MADMDDHIEFASKLLDFDFPETHPAAIAPSTIGCDHQFIRMWVEFHSHTIPPTANGRNGKLCGAMVDSDTYPALIVRQVIDPIGHDFSEFFISKTVGIYLFGFTLSLPLPPSVLESADQLLFLNIHGNNRKAIILELHNFIGNIKKLGISVLMLSAFIRLSVRLHAVAEFIQKCPNCALTDLMSLSLQFFGQLGRALARPAK